MKNVVGSQAATQRRRQPTCKKWVFLCHYVHVGLGFGDLGFLGLGDLRGLGLWGFWGFGYFTIWVRVRGLWGFGCFGGLLHSVLSVLCVLSVT